MGSNIRVCRIFWFQQSLTWGATNLPELMKNQQTLGNRKFSEKEALLQFSYRLRRLAFFKNFEIFEKRRFDGLLKQTETMRSFRSFLFNVNGLGTRCSLSSRIF